MYKQEEFSCTGNPPAFMSKTIEKYMSERKMHKNIMCKYTSYTGKYTLYTGIEKQRLFLLKNFFINIQTNVRSYTNTVEINQE